MIKSQEGLKIVTFATAKEFQEDTRDGQEGSLVIYEDEIEGIRLILLSDNTGIPLNMTMQQIEDIKKRSVRER